MANITDIIIKSFALIGLVALTGVALYYIAKRIKKIKLPEQPLWPTERHMEKVGSECPTGWIYMGKDIDGQNICNNYYNIDIQKPKDCYDNNDSKIKKFPVISNWDKCQSDPLNCPQLQKRCRWIKKCGPKSNIQSITNNNRNGDELNTSTPYASWIGVSDKC